jgi:hypothetical protein
MSQQTWLDRKPPAPSLATLLNFADHHEAWVRCMGCDDLFIAVYPAKANPNRLRCRCGAKDSQVVRYVRYHYKQ